MVTLIERVEPEVTPGTVSLHLSEDELKTALHEYIISLGFETFQRKFLLFGGDSRRSETNTLNVHYVRDVRDRDKPDSSITTSYPTMWSTDTAGYKIAQRFYRNEEFTPQLIGDVEGEVIHPKQNDSVDVEVLINDIDFLDYLYWEKKYTLSQKEKFREKD